MKFRQIILILLFSFISKSSFSNANNSRLIEIVFCLDLSGSTNGLIDDVRDNLWDLVNQVSTYRPAPDLRIGVVAFSRPSFKKENGYVKILSPLTDKYEQVAYEMAKLKPSIEKGDQLVGMALKAATLGMEWSTDDDAIKVIFLIGNGHVNLDGMKYKEAYDEAAKKKIIINTIYCHSSNFKDEIPGWREIAKNTGGEQFELRVHKRNPLILTCKDTNHLHDLAKKLSETYIYYGTNGKEIYKMEELIDKTALLGNEMAFQSRMFYKVSELYQLKQGAWDLVDYLKISNSDFGELNFDQLADTLKTWSPDFLRKMVMTKKDERLKIITEMRSLLKFDRQKVINKQIKEKEYDKNPDTFDRIIISWLNKKAAEKGHDTFVN